MHHQCCHIFYLFTDSLTESTSKLLLIQLERSWLGNCLIRGGSTTNILRIQLPKGDQIGSTTGATTIRVSTEEPCIKMNALI